MNLLSLDEIFGRLDNFKISDAISSVVEKHYGYAVLMTWPKTIPLAHKLPHFTWSISGFLECEGFARFFNLKCKHMAYAECFDLLGLTPLAASIRKSLALFPACDLGDTDALILHFGSWEQIERLVSGTESELYDKSGEIETAVATYVRAHKAEYEPLLREIRETRACKALHDEKTTS